MVLNNVIIAKKDSRFAFFTTHHPKQPPQFTDIQRQSTDLRCSLNKIHHAFKKRSLNARGIEGRFIESNFFGISVMQGDYAEFHFTKKEFLFQ